MDKQTNRHTMKLVMILLALSIAACDMRVGGASDDIPVTLAGAAPADILLYLYDVVLTPHMLTDRNGEGGGVLVLPGLCRNGKPPTIGGHCPDIPDYDYEYESNEEKE